MARRVPRIFGVEMAHTEDPNQFQLQREKLSVTVMLTNAAHVPWKAWASMGSVAFAAWGKTAQVAVSNIEKKLKELATGVEAMKRG